MNKPIVVLNSGGFDSICLCHYLDEVDSPKVYSLFFDYGQNSAEQERKCAKKISDSKGFEFVEVTIPRFNWSINDIYSKSYKGEGTDYLEMRNLVFLSYAVSFCESVDADSIYLAFISTPRDFKDTSEDFINRFNSIAEISGVKVYTPLKSLYKQDLYKYVFYNNITEEDYFSCEYPINGKPCGKCCKCSDIDYIENIRKRNDSLSIWELKSSPYSKDFKRGISNVGLKFIDLEISDTDLTQVIKQSQDLGVRDYRIHFSDSKDIKKYIDLIKQQENCNIYLYPSSECIKDLGKTIKTFDIKGVCIDYDEILNGNIKTGYTKDLDPQKLIIFGDADSIEFSNDFGVMNFIIYSGDKSISSKDIEQKYLEALDFSEKNINTGYVKFVVGLKDFYSIDSRSELYNDIQNIVIEEYNNFIYDNLELIIEPMCMGFCDYAYIDDSGKVYGCNKKICSSGNIKDSDLVKLISKGRDLSIEINKMHYRKGVWYFDNKNKCYLKV
jgi:7-cyano-7-deazaguanine synthase in queuosine biosynthesis